MKSRFWSYLKSLKAGPQRIKIFLSNRIRFNAGLSVLSKLILKFIWKCKGLKITKTTVGKKENKGKLFILLDSKTYYMAAIIQTVVSDSSTIKSWLHLLLTLGKSPNLYKLESSSL